MCVVLCIRLLSCFLIIILARFVALCLIHKLGHSQDANKTKRHLQMFAMQSVSFTSKIWHNSSAWPTQQLHAPGLGRKPPATQANTAVSTPQPTSPSQSLLFLQLYLPIVPLSPPLPLPHPQPSLFLRLTPLPLLSLILIATFS